MARPAVESSKGLHGSRIHPWAVLWRADSAERGGASGRWVSIGGQAMNGHATERHARERHALVRDPANADLAAEGTVLHAAAPAWWAAVATDGQRALGASASGDRLGRLDCASAWSAREDVESLEGVRVSPRLRVDAGRSREARFRSPVTVETGLRGRTVALLPRWGGVLLVTRTVLLFADRELSPRILQGGFDHLAGVCPMGEPMA